MEHVLQRLRDLLELVQRAGPYLLLEVLLPGGTLVALLLFAYRRREARRLAGHAAGSLDRLLDRLLVRFDDTLDLGVVAGRNRDGAGDGLEPLGLSAF